MQRAGRPPWFAALALVLAAAALVGVWTAVGLLLDGHTSGTEQGWISDVEAGRSSPVTEAAKVLSTLGSSVVLIPATLLVALVLVLRRETLLAGFVVTTAAGGLELATVVKTIVGRPRPPVSERLVTIGSTSFPSGHATQNAAILPALALAAVAFGAGRRIALGIAALLAFAVGLSRVLLGVHYPTDVLAGWLAGGLWALLCGSVATALQRRGKVERAGPEPEVAAQS